MSSSAGDHSFPLSLKPAPSHNDNAEPLDQLLMRIVQDRGSFRNVTEEGLEQELKAQADKDSEEDNAEEEQPEERKTREEILAAKREMIQFLGRAQNDALLALDFISLLLSKYVPKGADSMSPALKQAVPPATLDIDKWPSAPPSEADKRKGLIVAKGWRAKSLSSAADSLLEAATRLEKEVERETRYWEQVLSIKEKGWAIRRFPRERHTLGVQFGFAEANPYFRNRGFVPLRMDEEGNIILDPELTQNPKGVRIRIVEGGKVVGVSDLQSYSPSQHTPIEDLIRRARNSLFEEELFHEISLESRILVSYNVRERDSVIYLSLPEGPRSREVLIDLVPLDEMHPPPDDTKHNSTANNIALALRILLSHAHCEKLRRRSQIPPPLSELKRQELPPPIIRPLLGFLHHQSAVKCLRAYFSRVKSIFTSAGLPDTTFTLKFDPALTNLVQSISSKEDSKQTTLTPTEKLVNILIASNSAVASLALPSKISPTDRLVVSITTQIVPPKYGTEYVLTIPKRIATQLFDPSSLSAAGTRTFTYQSFSELAAYLDDLVALDVVHNLLGSSPEISKYWEPAYGGVAHLRVKEGFPMDSQAKKGLKTVKVEFRGWGDEVQTGKLVIKEETAALFKEFVWDGSPGKPSLLNVMMDVLGSATPSA